jgi:acyl-CoA thioester hydrolase
VDGTAQTLFNPPASRRAMTEPKPRPAPSTRADYRYFQTITTRWQDNDAFGHVNNVVYYSWIDTAVNNFLIQNNILELGSSEIVGVVAETNLRYLREIAYPDPITVGVRVERLGTSSVRYASAVFRADETTASAEGFFVHVYVQRATMKPTPIPAAQRAAFQSIM